MKRAEKTQGPDGREVHQASTLKGRQKKTKMKTDNGSQEERHEPDLQNVILNIWETQQKEKVFLNFSFI